jgi:hypothetical protein
MPYSDPKRQRKANAAAQRRRRARRAVASGGTITPLVTPRAPVRLTADELSAIVAKELSAIRAADGITAASARAGDRKCPTLPPVTTTSSPLSARIEWPPRTRQTLPLTALGACRECSQR